MTTKKHSKAARPAKARVRKAAAVARPTIEQQRAALEQFQRIPGGGMAVPAHPFIGETPQETIRTCSIVVQFLQDAHEHDVSSAGDEIYIAVQGALDHAVRVLELIGQEAGALRTRRVAEAQKVQS